MILTEQNLTTADVRKVAEAVGRYLNTNSELSDPMACARPLPRCPVAAGLKAAIGLAEYAYRKGDGGDDIRAIAREMLRAGARIEVEE